MIVFLCVATVFAQSQKTINASIPKPNAHLKVFNLAIASGDANTAVTALNYFITEQGANTSYADTLVMLYMQQGLFHKAIIGLINALNQILKTIPYLS